MNRQDICILINSSPKYYYLLPLQLTMLRRYAPELKWPVYFATETPHHPIVSQLEHTFKVNLILLNDSDAGFLESREVALHMLPSSISYVLPLQEDFLLDRTPDYQALSDALFILDTDRNVASLRLNPCPGPQENDIVYVKDKPWKILGSSNEYIFTYQATLWRKRDLHSYFIALLNDIEKNFGANLTPEKKKQIALQMNIGENSHGQKLLQKALPYVYHLAWPRQGKWSNAVYLCPWPYRPTAVVRGKLEPFAEELFQREGVKFEKPNVNMMS